MSKILSIHDSPGNKISFYHLAAFLVLLPFDRFFSEVILISLLVHSLIQVNKERFRKVFTIQNLVLASVFFLAIAGMAWSQDRGQGMKDLQRQLAILLFPFILSITGLDHYKYRQKLFLLFGLTCVFVVLYLYADALRVLYYYKLPLRSLFSPAFINHNFSQPIGLHATYLSMYIAFSIGTFLFYLLGEQKKGVQLLYLAGVGILMAGLIQLASRAVLITTMIGIIPTIGFFMLRGGKLFRFAGVWLIVLGVGILGISKTSSFNKRYVGDLKNDLTQASINNEVLEPRIVRWEHTLGLVRGAMLVGHGSGSEKRLLKEMYFREKLYNSYLYELNAHNQYLSLLLKTGVLGLLVFLGTIFYGFVAGWRRGDILLITFLLLVSVVSFSENILDVNKGIFFYAFFFSFLLKGENRQ